MEICKKEGVNFFCSVLNSLKETDKHFEKRFFCCGAYSLFFVKKFKTGSIYKVTDFGLATFEIRMDDFEGGAPVWSAPELLEKRGDASRAVDVFSFGYLLWHILLWKNEEARNKRTIVSVGFCLLTRFCSNFIQTLKTRRS